MSCTPLRGARELTAPEIKLRPCERSDLEAVNAVIERAVMTWDLPERVKRLSLATYRYTEHDLEHLHLVLAESGVGAVLGVAAWEDAAANDTPERCGGLLLHGLYVDPAVHRTGVGSRLLSAAQQAVRERGLAGLLVKAQRGAEGFFLASGFQPLTVQDPARDYPHRFWWPAG